MGTSKKIASLNVIEIAELPMIEHIYPEANKEYTISIKGEYATLGFGTKKKVLKIEQWGNTGLTNIEVNRCSNLTEIASPNKDSFKNIKNFSGMFAGTGLTSIPEDLFANCPNVIDFSGTFYNTKITEIPEELFKNCNKAESFLGTFANCTELTNYLPLWDSQYYNGGNTNVGIDKVGESCYGGCTKLLQKEENLNAIPEFWRTDLN